MYSKEEIHSVLTKKELKEGLIKYLEIMDMLYKVNVSEDRDFQKKYNHFYRMRQRKAEFYQLYYDYMEQMKHNNATITFEDVFSYIQEKTSRCETSFSSKLLATINPNMPVWDSFVLENLGIKKIYPSAKDKEIKIVSAYNKICQWYEKFINTEEAKLIVDTFDEIYPHTEITDTKKIDLFLWQNRK